MNRPQQFASDNYSGVCPEALDAVIAANRGHALAYGEDEWTEKATDAIREVFERDCDVFFVFNGTAANSLALSSLCQSYHSIIAADTAHIETDECGAPEFFSNGSKILTVPNRGGKLTPEAVEHAVVRRTDIHYPKPKVVSVTQATETGTVYGREDLLALRAMADKHSLKIHMDGARFANAVAALGLKPRQVTWECGVDVLCFGGTKNGLAVGEAVVFFDKALAEDFDYRCKQAGQLASKMRFIAAGWHGILSSGAWLRNAAHANACARQLEGGLKSLGLSPLFPCEANSVFVKIPEKAFKTMHDKGWHFYNFIGVDACRFMCSWDTTEESVRDFLEDLKSSL